MAAQPAAAGPMSAAEMERFEVEGFCTIDSPLTAAQLDIAERAYDSLMAPTPEGVERHQCFNSRLATPVHADADFVATITHAFFEQVASQILRAVMWSTSRCSRWRGRRPRTPTTAAGPTGGTSGPGAPTAISS